VKQRKKKERITMGICFSTDDDDGIETIKESELLIKCKTGDLIIFAGSGYDSEAIRFVCEKSRPWTHVGMVVRDKRNIPYLLEANKGITPVDHYTGEWKDGVRLSRLEDKLENYHGKRIAYRSLKLHENVRTSYVWITTLWQFIANKSPMDYTTSYEELLYSGLEIPSISLCEQDNTYFCTKLVADAYMTLGIFSRNYKDSGNKYTLYDFTSKSDREPYGLNKYNNYRLAHLRDEKDILIGE
jgi:hypothetical protein